MEQDFGRNRKDQDRIKNTSGGFCLEKGVIF